RQLVGELLGFTAREGVALLPLVDVRAATLDEVAGQTLSQTGALVASGISEGLEVAVQQAEQAKEGRFVAAVRCCGEQDHVPARALGEATQEVVALVTSTAGRGARVGLIDDHEVGAGTQKLGPSTLALDVVEAHHRVRVSGKD